MQGLVSSFRSFFFYTTGRGDRERESQKVRGRQRHASCTCGGFVSSWRLQWRIAFGLMLRRPMQTCARVRVRTGALGFLHSDTCTRPCTRARACARDASTHAHARACVAVFLYANACTRASTQHACCTELYLQTSHWGSQETSESNRRSQPRSAQLSRLQGLTSAQLAVHSR